MNKLYLLLSVLLISGTLYSQRTSADLYRGYVRYESATEHGTITLLSTGFGKKKTESIHDATKEAFQTLLFIGIPGSQYELPMLPDAEKKKNSVVRSLLEGGYASFVLENTVQQEHKKAKKTDGASGFMTVNRITINYNALRRYLEQNAVIRKFGI